MTWLLPEEGEQVADTLYPSEEPEGQKEPAFEEDYETADSKVHENLSGHSHFVMAGYRKWNRVYVRTGKGVDKAGVVMLLVHPVPSRRRATLYSSFSL